MSVHIIGGNPGANLENLSDYSGGTIVTYPVELNINMATTVVNDGTTTRQIQKQEVLLLMELFMQYLVRLNWPVVSS